STPCRDSTSGARCGGAPTSTPSASTTAPCSSRRIRARRPVAARRTRSISPPSAPGMRCVMSMRSSARRAATARRWAASPPRCSTIRCPGRACDASMPCSPGAAVRGGARRRDVCDRSRRRNARCPAPETYARARPAAGRRDARPRPAAHPISAPGDPIRVAAVTGRASFGRRGRMTADAISPDLKTVLRRLKLGRMLDTLPERLVLARHQKMPHQDFLTLVLGDEATRRDSLAVALRVQRGHLDPALHLDAWDPTSKVTFDRALLNELTTLRFLEAHAHVAIVGPVGVGKTFLAHALGHIACRRGRTVLAIRTDHMLKTLKHTRLDNSYEVEVRKLLAVDLLILDDFALDTLDPTESRDLYEVLTERHRAGSIIVTSNRRPDEWLITFADPLRAQSAIDRFTSNAYDLVIDGESYRQRLKPTLKTATW